MNYVTELSALLRLNGENGELEGRGCGIGKAGLYDKSYGLTGNALNAAVYKMLEDPTLTAGSRNYLDLAVGAEAADRSSIPKYTTRFQLSLRLS